jgi:hypothetical protein
MTSNTQDLNPSKYLGNELNYLKKVLEGESWSASGGSWANTLEKEFAKRFGVKYGIAFNSGTSTLHAALEAAGVGPGDEVISPALTVIMNTTATIHANAVPGIQTAYEKYKKKAKKAAEGRTKQEKEPETAADVMKWLIKAVNKLQGLDTSAWTEDEKGAFNQTPMDLHETIRSILNPSEADPLS